MENSSKSIVTPSLFHAFVQDHLFIRDTTIEFNGPFIYPVPGTNVSNDELLHNGKTISSSREM